MEAVSVHTTHAAAAGTDPHDGGAGGMRAQSCLLRWCVGVLPFVLVRASRVSVNVP